MPCSVSVDKILTKFADSITIRHGASYAAIGLLLLVLSVDPLQYRAVQPSITKSGYCTIRSSQLQVITRAATAA